MVIQVKSATKEGFETAKEGDSVNLSMPNSKTRRGRVGVGVAQTLDTQSNISVLLPNLATHDKISCIFEDKIKIYASKEERNTTKALFALWKEIGTESFTEWGFGVSNTFQQEKILQPYVYVTSIRCETCKDGYITIECKTPFKKINPKRELRIMWEGKCKRCSSQGQRYSQQCEGKFNEDLQELPHQITSQKSFLQNLRGTSILFRVLQQTLFAISEIWRPELHEVQSRIRRLSEVECERLQGFPDNWTKFGVYEKQVWINKKEKTFKIVEGVQEISRTQRYKLCGNAVTKKIVELIGKKLIEKI
jgi:hypothetical protein